jgi:small redox-active disulfide protein 2
MKLEILGPGCANCAKLKAITDEAVSDLALDDVEVSKVEDFAQVMAYGVMATPALAIDGKVVVSGRIPTKPEVASLITTALLEQSD